MNSLFIYIYTSKTVLLASASKHIFLADVFKIINGIRKITEKENCRNYLAALNTLLPAFKKSSEKKAY